MQAPGSSQSQRTVFCQTLLSAFLIYPPDYIPFIRGKRMFVRGKTFFEKTFLYGAGTQILARPRRATPRTPPPPGSRDTWRMACCRPREGATEFAGPRSTGGEGAPGRPTARVRGARGLPGDPAGPPEGRWPAGPGRPRSQPRPASGMQALGKGPLPPQGC